MGPGGDQIYDTTINDDILCAGGGLGVWSSIYTSGGRLREFPWKTSRDKIESELKVVRSDLVPLLKSDGTRFVPSYHLAP